MHLADKCNSELLLYLKTAFELKLPISNFLSEDLGLFTRRKLVFFGDEPFYEELPQTVFTQFDLSMSVAYQHYLSSMCGRCGTPVWYGRSEHNGIEFELKTTTCFSCAAVDEEQSDKNYKRGHGETLYAVPHGTRYDDGSEDPLPSPEEAMSKVG